MKKLFKGAVPTIALLLVAIISLSSVTYAWFTAGSEATVDTITVNVEEVNGLLVSASGYNGTWGSTLTPVISNASAKLTNVSSAGELDSNGNLKFWTAEYNNAYDAFTSTTLVSSNSNSYYKFTMYVKNEGSSDIYVNLDGSNLGTGDDWSKAASRIAIVDMGSATASAALNNSTAPSITAGSEKLIGIWEPFSDTHTQDGISWLTKNNVPMGTGNTSYGPVSYMAINKALTASTSEDTEAYTNVKTGEVFTIVKDDSTTTDVNEAILVLGAIKTETTASPNYAYYDETCVPKNGTESYYKYSGTAANHFVVLNIDDFFKVANEVNTLINIKSDILDKDAARVVPTAPSAIVVDTKAPTDTAFATYKTNKGITGDPTVAQLVEYQLSDDYATYLASTDYVSYKATADYTTFTTSADYIAWEAYKTAIKAYIGEATGADLTAKIQAAKDAKDTAYTNALANWDFYTKATVSDETIYKQVELTDTIQTQNVTYYQKTSVGYVAGTGSVNTAEVKAYKKTANVSLKTLSAADAFDNDSTTVDVVKDPSAFVFSVGGNKIVKLDVYIWIEGQDCDCTNYVAGIPFQVNFKIKKTTAPATE